MKCKLQRTLMLNVGVSFRYANHETNIKYKRGHLNFKTFVRSVKSALKLKVI